ncbi:MAG: carbamoyltransferase HypF [Chthoniobacterales bacterium]|nr:carbamoyltransferase HypF [Chthoniobacterales bacterium]
MKDNGIERARVQIRGAVQGVGFRPFVYRLATELSLRGWVNNSSQGVFLEVEGGASQLRSFLARLTKEKPPRAVIQSCESVQLDPVGYEAFEIRESEESGGKTAFILPDIATCEDCLREIFEPQDRRFRYPFTNCTNCGPRFSIIEALPYDRANTAMKKFEMCADCAREYRDPTDRRFHAEPTACPRCGPQLQFWDSLGQNLAQSDSALRLAAEKIRDGKIVAVKGIGGFQLLVDARNQGAVSRLRERKHREEKPFAVMVPSLESARECCEISELEEGLLVSPESPIVLLARSCRASASLAEAEGATGAVALQLAASLAPGNPNLGIMLPYSPLHHLLLHELSFPLVATSGNLSDEPICTDEMEALTRMRDLADYFLVHDRPVVRHVDDSIVRVMAEREMILRRARGYAPLPVTLHRSQPTVLAVGAHLKNAVALSVDRNVFVSQHIGDLATKEAHDAFTRSVADLPRLYEAQPEIIAHDLHPEYLSTKHALQLPGRKAGVQHHWAHIASCMAENEIEPPLLGVAWDGTGYGTDGTIWGGEFFLVTRDSCRRIAHLRTFRLPGGDAAIREPRRSALGLLHEIFGEETWEHPAVVANFSGAELKILRGMLRRQVNSPLTSSAGRLFDGIAALAGLCTRSTFEGQAAMKLEFAIADRAEESYPFTLRPTTPAVIDWEPGVRALLEDRRQNIAPGQIAARFHNMLAEVVLAVARQADQPRVVLSGGCFQNRYLTERVICQLRAAGSQPYWPQRIPPNDGGIALGQVWAATSSIGEVT